MKTANDIANESLRNLIGSQAMLLAQTGGRLVVAEARIKELEAEVASLKPKGE